MFIKALIADEQGNQRIIKVEDKCDVIVPNGFIEQMRFAIATTKLLSKFYNECKAYANPEHSIVSIETDNALIAKELQKASYNAVFTLLDVDLLDGDSGEG